MYYVHRYPPIHNFQSSSFLLHRLNLLIFPLQIFHIRICLSGLSFDAFIPTLICRLQSLIIHMRCSIFPVFLTDANESNMHVKWGINISENQQKNPSSDKTPSGMTPRIGLGSFRQQSRILFFCVSVWVYVRRSRPFTFKENRCARISEVQTQNN